MPPTSRRHISFHPNSSPASVLSDREGICRLVISTRQGARETFCAVVAAWRIGVNLSTKSRYGVRILTDIALNQSNGPVQNSEIAKRQDISLQYVVQIVRLLKSDKLVATVRGPKGGHVLAVPPNKITCGQLVRLLETHSDLVRCGPNAKVCKRSKECQIRLVWMDATEALFERLDSVTIADLVARIQNASEERCPRGTIPSPARVPRRSR